jgi:Ca-activated chloride channel family protein
LVLALSSSRASALGLLVPTDPGIPALRVVRHHVEVQVHERGATTHVTQEFQNDSARPLEATFLFPMPGGATVDELALWMNGTRTIGTVMERGAARRTYEQIVQRVRDPGLIEYVDHEMLQARVFPVPAHGRQKIELTYSELVSYDGGVHRYVYPLKADPRAVNTLEDFSLHVHVDSKLPIRNVYSPMAHVEATHRGTTADASLEKSALTAGDDFLLYWSVDDADVGITVLTDREPGESGYFMLLASPKDAVRDREIIGKRVLFVVDTSGSMEGEKLDATKRALAQCLDKLGDDDLFNIVHFGGYAESMSPKMLSASMANVAHAKDEVRGLSALGGTNIDEAFDLAFQSVSGSDKAPLIVVFMTDGRPTVGEIDVVKLTKLVQDRAHDKHARVFVLGVGDDLNTTLLDKLSSDGASALYLKGNASLEPEVNAFYDRISHPVLTDLQLELPDVGATALLPRHLPDLYKGQQIVVVGRYAHAGEGTVRITGTTSMGPRTFTQKVTFVDGHSGNGFIARLWAQRQVGLLLAEIRDHGENRGLIDEVTQLATRFGIITPYTSYLVVEPGTIAQPMPPPHPMPRRPEMSTPRDDLAWGPPAAAPMTSSSGLSGGVHADKKARESLRDVEGERAVATAKEIGALKSSNSAGNQAATSERRASGHIFIKSDGSVVDGAFVDAQCQHGDRELEIAPYSAAWFAVAHLRPDLKEALALGERVRIHVAGGRTLVVSPRGKATVDDVTLRAFVGAEGGSR